MPHGLWIEKESKTDPQRIRSDIYQNTMAGLEAVVQRERRPMLVMDNQGFPTDMIAPDGQVFRVDLKPHK
jgi:hypothetical protein